MARGVKVQWDGVEQLKKTFEAAGVALDDRTSEVKDIIIGPATAWQKNARNLAPERTGALRRGIYVTRGNDKQRGIYMGVRKKIFYARFVEMGTSKMTARPYFRPAILQMFSTYISDIQPGVKRLVEKTAAGAAYHPPG